MAGAAQGVDEREVKLAVPEGFVMPALDQLAGVAVIDRGDVLLEAVYWDTTDLGLAGHGVGVRHRNGTWAFKGRSRRDGNAVVREELELGGPAQRIPDPIRARIAPLVDVARVHPVADVRTTRHTFDVSADEQAVEVVHDRVSVHDGTAVRGRFEEVEVEYANGSTALANRVVALLAGHGATLDPTAKYVRALRLLGHDPSPVSE